jgi:hypothetical protein
MQSSVSNCCKTHTPIQVLGGMLSVYMQSDPVFKLGFGGSRIWKNGSQYWNGMV